MQKLTRRKFLAGSAAALAVSGRFGRLWAEGQPTPGRPRIHPSKRGHRLSVLPFDGEAEVSFGVTEGKGLYGRRLLDLSDVDDSTLVTPADRYFVRTRAPEFLPDEMRLTLRTLTGPPLDLPLRDVEAMAEPQGAHLCECSENGAEVRFGLMSAAEWKGVSLEKLLALVEKPEGDWLLIVEGFDRFAATGVQVNAGASWILTPRDIRATGAFLATAMNGGPLSPDHGAPLRLVVPGWYGCTWIKWVHSLVIVPYDIQATPHMKEFAGKTHQVRRPRRASDFLPAVVDAVALPVRIERWKWRGYYYYRICGVVWGGAEPAESVLIRLDPKEPFVPVDWFPPPESATQWATWSHDWCPPVPGVYPIELAVGDSRLRTRRLSAGDYLRSVRIEEI